jgi:hypothetical protein
VAISPGFQRISGAATRASLTIEVRKARLEGVVVMAIRHAHEPWKPPERSKRDSGVTFDCEYEIKTIKRARFFLFSRGTHS